MKNLKIKDRVIFELSSFLREGVVLEVSPSTNFVKIEHDGLGRTQIWVHDDSILEVLDR